MQEIGTNIRKYLQKLRTPEFITGAASGILAALLLEAVSEVVQKSLNHQIVGFYLMAVVALVCLILVRLFPDAYRKAGRKSQLYPIHHQQT